MFEILVSFFFSEYFDKRYVSVVIIIQKALRTRNIMSNIKAFIATTLNLKSFILRPSFSFLKNISQV